MQKMVKSVWEPENTSERRKYTKWGQEEEEEVIHETREGLSLSWLTFTESQL